MIRRSQRLLVSVAAITIFIGGLGATPARAADPISQLRSQILNALKGSTSHSKGFFVTVSGLPGAAKLNAGTPFLPASNQKMYVALADLLQLTPTRQLGTAVRRTGPVVDGTLQGDLILRGVGDPTLNGAALREIASSVAAAGIHRVTGYLWADDTRYDRVRSAPGWKPNYVPDEIGPLSALAVGEDGWRRDRAYVRNPAVPNADRFRAALRNIGITIAKATKLGKPSGPTAIVTSHPSMTVAALVRRMLKISDNFVAEELLKELAASTHVQGTTARGIKVMWQWAARLGVPHGTAYDGSGLSWWDRETPSNEVAWLRAAEGSNVSAEFLDALPIACVDGTLKDRFCNTPAEGKVFAKTGTLPGVVTLAGYTTTASGRHVRFAFMLNRNDNNWSARTAVDRAVVAIVKFAG